MAIKRLTIELDDTQDAQRPTSSPSSLLPKDDVQVIRVPTTETPDRQPEYQNAGASEYTETRSSKTVVGRTLADLVSNYMNQPECMAVVFFVLAFLISVAKLQKFTDFWIPLAIGVTLNCVWFIFRGLRKLCQRKDAPRFSA
jgi:hypothetical protein